MTTLGKPSFGSWRRNRGMIAAIPHPDWVLLAKRPRNLAMTLMIAAVHDFPDGREWNEVPDAQTCPPFRAAPAARAASQVRNISTTGSTLTHLPPAFQLKAKCQGIRNATACLGCPVEGDQAAKAR